MLLWLDMEMTGLDIEKEVPIEVACLVTDWNLQTLGNFHAVIRQPQEYLDRMDDWNKTHHRDSGLTEKVPGGVPPVEVETQLCDLVAKHFGKERAVLAGNSISQDRLFITKYFKRFDSLLHYRMLDVSSWKLVFNNRYGLKFTKKQSHRAVDDIQESIDEMKFYLQYIQAPQLQLPQ
jgi:oligoribonuclease